MFSSRLCVRYDIFEFGWSIMSDNTLIKFQTQAEVHRALCNNVDTKQCIDSLVNLIKTAEPFLVKDGASPLLLQKCAVYITHILSVFGVVEGNTDAMGYVWLPSSAVVLVCEFSVILVRT